MSTILEGTVTRQGQPYEGAYVRLIGPSGEYVSERRTQEDGAFKFNLSAGSWKLKWKAPGGTEGEESIELQTDETRTFEIKLP